MYSLLLLAISFCFFDFNLIKANDLLPFVNISEHEDKVVVVIKRLEQENIKAWFNNQKNVLNLSSKYNDFCINLFEDEIEITVDNTKRIIAQKAEYKQRDKEYQEACARAPEGVFPLREGKLLLPHTSFYEHELSSDTTLCLPDIQYYPSKNTVIIIFPINRIEIPIQINSEKSHLPFDPEEETPHSSVGNINQWD